MINQWHYQCLKCLKFFNDTKKLPNILCPLCKSKTPIHLKNYFCIKCDNSFSEIKNTLPLKCPKCNDSGTIFRYLYNETVALHGKKIDSILKNEWKNFSKLIIFEDGDKAIVNLIYSDEIEIKILH